MLQNVSLNAWNVAVALVVILLSWWASRIAKRAVARLIQHLGGLSDDFKRLTARTAAYVVLLLGIGIALAVLGIGTQPLITAVLVIAAVGFLALRGIADNFAAGIVIQTRRPIHVDDEIDALGFVGTVQELNSRAVIIRTFDGRVVHLPNKQVGHFVTREPHPP